MGNGCQAESSVSFGRLVWGREKTKKTGVTGWKVLELGVRKRWDGFFAGLHFDVNIALAWHGREWRGIPGVCAWSDGRRNGKMDG